MTPPFAATSRSSPVATVVVPTRNAGVMLEKLLDALSNQTIPAGNFEVIIGDDGSTDGSSERLAFASDGWVRIAKSRSANSYAARNRAARVASASVLAFCDADCRPEPGWLEAGLTAMERADIVGGAILPVTPCKPKIWTLLDLDLHVDQEWSTRKGRALGGNLFVTRELFDTVGGFDESLPNGGDYDFVARCVERGSRLVYASDAVVWHPTHNRARTFLRKVWRIQRAAGVRQCRIGQEPRFLRRGLIPVVGMAKNRHDTGKPRRLDRTRLEAAGIRPHLAQELCALGVMYLVLPYVGSAARLRGRRLHRQQNC